MPGTTHQDAATDPSDPRATRAESGIPAVVLAPGADDPAGFAPCWADLLGRPVVAWAVGTLGAAPEIGVVALVVPARRAAAARRLARAAGWAKVRIVVAPAGAGPAEQVRAALDQLPPSGSALIHDGARPLLARATLAALIAATEVDGPTLAVAAVPVRETMKWVDAAGDVRGTPPRDGLWHPQYPAVCPRAVVERALRGPRATAITASSAGGLAWLLDACAECAARLVRAPDDDLPVRGPEDLAMGAGVLGEARSESSGRPGGVDPIT